MEDTEPHSGQAASASVGGAGGNVSTFSVSDMEFLNFEANDDSLDLSLSGEEYHYANNSGIFSSVASQDSSDWSPSTFSGANSDYDVSQDILGDIHLPSLGETGTARKILSQLLSENIPEHTHHHHHRPQYPSSPISYAKEGHLALQHMNEDIKHTREHTAALQVEISQLKKQQMASRDELQDLDIGENLFHQLSKLSPNEMTLREFACLRAATVYMPLRKQVQDLERNLQEVQVQLEMSNGTIETQSSELSRQRKQSNSVQESLRLDLMASEERGDRLNTRLQAEMVKRQEREAQAARCDEAVAEAEAMRKEASVLRNTVEEQSSLLQVLTAADRNHSDLLADMTKAKEMLAMDKAYLQRELGEVTTAAHEQSRKLDAQQLHTEKLEAKILDLTDQLVSVQMSTRTAFDERMEKEVARLRLDYDKDMSSIKDTSKEISDHENRILREIRQNLEKELDVVRQKLDDKTAEVNSLTRELADVRSATESEVSMLRAEVKMKHFEVTSLGATFEERSSQLKLAQLDLDVLREEVSVHKTALLKMEAERDSRCNRLEENLARAYETIHAYDVLFKDDSHDDKDNMLKDQYQGQRRRSVSASHVDDDDEYGDEDFEPEEQEEEQNNKDENRSKATRSRALSNTSSYSNTFDYGRSKSGRQHSLSVLVSNPRKFRQLLDSSERNIELIAKLQQKIKELEVKNKHLLKDKKELKEEISRNIRELSLVPKSNKHIIDLYTQKDDECRLLHSKVSSAEEEARKYARNVDAYVQQNASLKDQMTTLIEERQEILELKAMLIDLQEQAGEEGDDDDDDEEEEIDEEKGASASAPVQRNVSGSSFTEEQLQSPIFRQHADAQLDANTEHATTEDVLDDRYHHLATPPTNTARGGPTTTHDDGQTGGAGSGSDTYHSNHEDSYSSDHGNHTSTPDSTFKLAAGLGLSPMVLQTMVERNPTNTPMRSPQQRSGSRRQSGLGSPVKKIGFHVRSPAGK